MDTKLYRFTQFEQHLLYDAKPSDYFNALLNEEWFLTDYPYSILSSLQKVPQSPEHHPEGNVWNHTMLTVDEASLHKQESRNPKVFMWAALLHDVGKMPATKMRKGRITAYDHDKMGEHLASEFLNFFAFDKHLLKQVTAMVRWHMQPLFVNKKLPFADICTMLQEVDLQEIALLSLCDRWGRANLSPALKAEEKRKTDSFIQYCREYEGTYSMGENPSPRTS